VGRRRRDLKEKRELFQSQRVQSGGRVPATKCGLIWLRVCLDQTEYPHDCKHNYCTKRLMPHQSGVTSTSLPWHTQAARGGASLKQNVSKHSRFLPPIRPKLAKCSSPNAPTSKSSHPDPCCYKTFSVFSPCLHIPFAIRGLHIFKP